MKRRDFLKTGGAAIAGGALIGVSGSLATSCLSPTGRDRDLGSTDVLVVGGGPAGVCAAIAAARCGAKTVIAEQGNCLGGMATRGLVAPFMTCYDTTGDIRDTWQSMAGIGFDGQDRWAGFTGPGHWPDADMLVLGKVGWGRKMHWTELTPWEQYTHITLWSILASPMLLGCDMAMLDPFTLSLLCNSEVLDVNQDPLGIKGTVFAKGEDHVTYVKPLEDGSIAVALFNLGSEERTMGFTAKKLGLYGEQTVRDLWRQKDMGKTIDKERWEVSVPAHGCVLYRLSPGITGEKLEGLYRQ